MYETATLELVGHIGLTLRLTCPGCARVVDLEPGTVKRMGGLKLGEFRLKAICKACGARPDITLMDRQTGVGKQTGTGPLVPYRPTRFGQPVE